MQMSIATITEDNLKLDKRQAFENASPVTVNMQLFTPCDIDSPIFILSVSYATNYNYAYVPVWDKYYYLGEPTVIDGERCSIPAKCDVLTTYADYIKNLNVRVVRYQSKKQPYIPDGLIKKTVRTYTENLYFSGNPFTVGEGAIGNQIKYALSVVGGDGTSGGVGNATE